MKKIEYNFRSACALGIISCFVLFLTASAPHRVHHRFENLPYTGEVPQKETQPLTLTALAPTGEPDDQGHLSDHHPANEGHHRHGHHHHKHLARGNNHQHDPGEQHQLQPQPQAAHVSPERENSPNSDVPLEANVPHDDAHHDNSAQTVCLLQSAAQHSHLSAAQLEQVAFLPIESKEGIEGSFLPFSVFNSSPFSQRAPPKL